MGEATESYGVFTKVDRYCCVVLLIKSVKKTQTLQLIELISFVDLMVTNLT